MARVELIEALRKGSKEFLKSLENSSKKYFIRKNISNFVSPDDSEATGRLYSLLKDPNTTVEDICDQMRWDGFGIIETNQSKLLDLLYDPPKAAMFAEFRKVIAGASGTGTVVFIAGKKAVVVTNIASIGTDRGTYRAVKEMDATIPDLKIIPWPAIVAQKWLITGV